MQSLQVDSVQRWMEDLRHMTEVECMCVLQAKPIGVEEDAQQGELIVAAGVGAGDHVARNNLQTLLRRALVVSTELGKMFQRLEKGRWQRVHSTAVRANCHVRSLVHEYSAARSTPPEMQKVTVDFGIQFDASTSFYAVRVELKNWTQAQRLPETPILLCSLWPSSADGDNVHFAKHI